jgi:hypothetical protein
MDGVGVCWSALSRCIARIVRPCRYEKGHKFQDQGNQNSLGGQFRSERSYACRPLSTMPVGMAERSWAWVGSHGGRCDVSKGTSELEDPKTGHQIVHLAPKRC